MTAATMPDLAGAVAPVAEVAAAYAAEADEHARFPAEALVALRESGLLGLIVPVRHGGVGGGLTELVDVTMGLARADLSVALIFAMHCQQVAALDRYGGEPLRTAVLPRVAAGRVYLGSVTTERGTGGDLLVSASPTREAAGRLHVDRDAPVVTGGEHADAFLLTVRAPDARTPHQVRLVYADRDQLDLSVLGDWQPLGMRATRSVPLRLVGDLPATQALGAPGDFPAMVRDVFGPIAHLGWSAAWLGAATGALSRTLRHLRDPVGRGDVDLSSDLLLTRIARIRGRLETVNALLRQAVRAVNAVLGPQDDGAGPGAPPARLLLNALKVTAAEETFAAVHELMELAGLRLGYLRGSPLALERTFRDLRSATLNYHNDRLLLASGSLCLLDPEVRLG